MAGAGNLSFVDDINKLQVIKCVVVGDRAVGKSHLVCARACGTKYTLQDLVQTHISTIWAVDHYRTNPEVKQRSICFVDCVTCSLQLWDTFGSHERDRQFALNNADVVLVCFSVVNRKSLEHIRTYWIHEIRRVCGSVPVVICACQVDMRYNYNDPVYLALGKDAFRRSIAVEDIVYPAEAKQVAKDLNAYYYETSVLVGYGIQEVFNNCVRAALMCKRRGKILVNFGSLKNVVKPHLQAPHMPPRPLPPTTVTPEPTEETASDAAMLDTDMFCDVAFLVHQQKLEAHLVYLVAASASFQAFFEAELHAVAGDARQLASLSVDNDLSVPSSFCSQDTLTGSSVSYQMRSLARTVLCLTDEQMYTSNDDDDTGLGESDSRIYGSRFVVERVDVLRRERVPLVQHPDRHRSVSAQQYAATPGALAQLPGISSVSTGQLLEIDGERKDNVGTRKKKKVPTATLR